MLVISRQFRVVHPLAEDVVGVYRVPSATEWKQYRAAMAGLGPGDGEDAFAGVIIALAHELEVEIEGVVTDDGSAVTYTDLGTAYVVRFGEVVAEVVAGKLSHRVSPHTAD